MWPTINKDLLPMKGHYFLFNAGTAPVQPFMPVYAKQLGFSSIVVGTVYSILPVSGMLAKPLFGAIADQFRLHKFLFLLFEVVTIVSFFSVQFVPEVPTETNNTVTLACGREVDFQTCKSGVSRECAADRILYESEMNLTVFCDFRCDLTPRLQSEVCGSWRVLQMCQSKPNSVDGIHTISKKSEVYGGKTAYDEDVSASRAVSHLEFSAAVPLQHTLQVSNCIYFRIKNVTFGDRTTHIPYCTSDEVTQCEVSCTDPSMNALLMKESAPDESVAVTTLYQFWLLLALLIVSWIGMSVVVSVADTICFEMLGPRGGEYGNQRLWGSVGWGIFAIISGLIVDEFSTDDVKKNYTPVFYILLVVLACDVVCSYSLKYQQNKISTNILRDVGMLLTNARVVLFALWCVFIGMCTGLQWNFFFWYLEDLATAQGCDTLAWIKTLQGLVSGVQCFLGELPSFFLSGWIMQKLGHVHTMSLVLFIVGVRFLLYSILSDPWWCLPIELLQANFGLFYSTMTSYASIVAPPGTEATMQGLVGAVFEGVGVSLGSLLAGFLFDSYSGATCFRIFGITAMVAGVLHLSAHYLINRFNPVLAMQSKGFNGIARYATPNEAVSMLGDT